MTELFGPLLGVMCAKNLDHAIELANQTGYGLTSGLESLDRREQERWKAKIRAGNLYINRGTTGAVTLRQPFGGVGKSSIGPGIKAGSPNYVSQFMETEETARPFVGTIRKDHALLQQVQEWKRKLAWGNLEENAEDLEKTGRAVKSYLYRFEQEFEKEKDYFHLRGQDNFLRFLPVGAVVVRLHPDDSLFDVLARAAAVSITGCHLTVSVPPDFFNSVTEFLRGSEGMRFLAGAKIVSQSDEQMIKELPAIQRIRYAAPDRVSIKVFKAAAETGFYICRSPVRMEGRIELLHYMQNQSICDMYHRHGNLGERAAP